MGGDLLDCRCGRYLTPGLAPTQPFLRFHCVPSRVPSPSIRHQRCYTETFWLVDVLFRYEIDYEIDYNL